MTGVAIMFVTLAGIESAMHAMKTNITIKRCEVNTPGNLCEYDRF